MRPRLPAGEARTRLRWSGLLALSSAEAPPEGCPAPRATLCLRCLRHRPLRPNSSRHRHHARCHRRCHRHGMQPRPRQGCLQGCHAVLHRPGERPQAHLGRRCFQHGTIPPQDRLHACQRRARKLRQPVFPVWIHRQIWLQRPSLTGPQNRVQPGLPLPCALPEQGPLAPHGAAPARRQPTPCSARHAGRSGLHRRRQDAPGGGLPSV